MIHTRASQTTAAADLYLAQVLELAAPLMAEVAVIRQHLIAADRGPDGHVTAEARRTIATSAARLQPAMYRLEKLRAPEELRDRQRLVQRCSAALVLWTVMLRQALMTADTGEANIAMERAGRHLDTALALYGQLGLIA